MAGIKGMTHYPLDFRQKIVNLHINEGFSLERLSLDYELNRSQVLSWCRWQRQYGLPKQMTGKKRGRPKVNPDSLEERLKFLEMENALLKKFNELLMEEETKRK